MASTSPLVTELESELLGSVAVDHGWRLIERFATLNRESGSADEFAAADYLSAELDRLGIEHQVHEPELYLSLPRSASVEIAGEPPFHGKPPSFAASTPERGCTAEAIHVPAAAVKDVSDLFEDHRDAGSDVRGKIVISEGYAMPLAVQRFEALGAAGQVYINPGRRVHWGICTSIWGTPSDADLPRKPGTPVLAISRPDGDRLLARVAANGGPVTIRTRLDEGWYRCKVPVATIRGRSDEFVLVHGHYDSWDVGIGDNAVGDATLLELARIFHAHRGRLWRSLRVAWWPAHSMGRYAGSAWYADRFAHDLRRRCVAAVDIDSPGCWHATAYEEVMWMAEAEELCRGAIRDATGIEPGRLRPIRAGDYSFNQIGLTSFFMLLSNIPRAERERLGFYPVGGCGGNIAWHTEDDRLPVADRRNLVRDLRVYVTALARVLSAEILPFDHRLAVREMAEAIEHYRTVAGGQVDLSPVTREISGLLAALDRFHEAIHAPRRSMAAETANQIIMELARLLVPVNYAVGEHFMHDAALPLGTVPRLAAIERLKSAPAEQRPFLIAGIQRQINVVANAFYEAARLVRQVV